MRLWRGPRGSVKADRSAEEGRVERRKGESSRVDLCPGVWSHWLEEWSTRQGRTVGDPWRLKTGQSKGRPYRNN